MKLALCAALASCCTSACNAPTTCAGIGVPDKITPTDTTIAIAVSFVAKVEIGGYCLSGDSSDATYSPVAVTWRTSDSLVVGVDALTGRVTGLGQGDAHITAIERPVDIISVHVR
jgi:hypothetical protein